MQFPLSALCVFVLAMAVRAEGSDLVRQARDAWAKGDTAAALELAGKAIRQDNGNPELHFLRGRMHEDLSRHADAIRDFDKCLQLDTSFADAHDHRGSEYFKLGKVTESLADFDRFIKARPEAANGHWKRGISLYYAGRYEEGRKQFNAYENVDTNDVENAVWHYLCNAKAAGVDKARKEILKIGKDKRTPMMEVYALFRGDLQPADVLASANAGAVPAAQRKAQLFYAHLYLGLYYDVLGDKRKALENLTLASSKYRIAHYMGDVAWVHEARLNH